MSVTPKQTGSAVSSTKKTADPTDPNWANTTGVRLRQPVTEKGATTTIAGVHFFDSKQGRPTLVFLHGLGRMLECWIGQIEALSKDFRCLAVDLPGHGQSVPPAEPTVPSLASAVGVLLKELAVEDCILVGHSMGCRVATRVWHDAAPRVRGIVYVDGSLFVSSADEVHAGGRHYIAKAIANAVENGADEATQRGLWRSQIPWDQARARPILQSVSVPVLLIQSTVLNADRSRREIAPGELTPWLELASDVLGRYRIERIAGAGHFVHHEKTDRVNQLIAGFSASLS